MTLEVKFELALNRIIEEIRDCGNVNTAATRETPDEQPGGLKASKLADLKEERAYSQEGEDVLEEVRLAKTSHERNSSTHFMTLNVQGLKCWKLIQS